ncbi:hypothetical protein [Nocardia sp. NPDC004123]
MTSRVDILAPESRFRCGGSEYTVIEVTGTDLRIRNVTGTERVVPVSQILADPGFALLDERRQPPFPPSEQIADLPAEVAEQAQWWEIHVVELLTGRRPDSPGFQRRRDGHGSGRAQWQFAVGTQGPARGDVDLPEVAAGAHPPGGCRPARGACRRTPGLRREEVAQLAGVTSWLHTP